MDMEYKQVTKIKQTERVYKELSWIGTFTFKFRDNFNIQNASFSCISKTRKYFCF